MDYHAIHGHDISSFDVPGTHRLPTVAASQALDELSDEFARPIPTGVESLDKALRGPAPVDSADSRRHHGGVKRGQVTEIWGPPGTGKTALAIQMAANTICDGNDVVWVDCFQKVHSQRVVQVVKSVKASRDQGVARDERSDIDWTKFMHYSCLTLPHLMSLISQPTTKSMGAQVSLIVVSSVSALLNSALPKAQHGNTGPRSGKGTPASAKRSQGLHFTINALQKLAATRNCAVVILSQCSTRMQSEQGATLVAAVNANVWEQGVTTRLVLFRDWAWQGKKPRSVCLAGLQKLDGKTTNEVVEHVSAFRVEPSGTASIDHDDVVAAGANATVNQAATGNPPAGPADPVHRKRKLGQAELEIADSEDDDEDYGWADKDEAALPAPPLQFQGSEDLLLGHSMGRSDDENEDEGNAGDGGY